MQSQIFPQASNLQMTPNRPLIELKKRGARNVAGSIATQRCC